MKEGKKNLLRMMAIQVKITMICDTADCICVCFTKIIDLEGVCFGLEGVSDLFFWWGEGRG